MSTKSLIFRSFSEEWLQKQLILQLEELSITSISHPDVKIIGNDSRTVSIKSVKELINWSAKKPYSSEFKLAVVDNAERLTFQAQNALLKSLEESNASTRFILLLHGQNPLLQTILSRCALIQDNSGLSANPDTHTGKLFAQSNLIDRFVLIEDIFKTKDTQKRELQFDDLMHQLVDYYSSVGDINSLKLLQDAFARGKKLSVSKYLLEDIAINLPKC